MPEQLDVSSEVSVATALSAEHSDETHHATQRGLHRVPLAVGQVLWQLLHQSDGAVTLLAAQAELAVHELNAEQQVVHAALQESADGPFGLEAEGHVQRGFGVQQCCLDVHVTAGLKRKHCACLAPGSCEACKAGAGVSVLVVDEQGRAHPTVVALVSIAPQEHRGADLATVQPPVLALLRTKASVATVVALADTTVLAWLLAPTGFRLDQGA